MDNVITKRCSKQSHGCPWQSCKATNHTVTLRNLPNPASGTYTSAHRNSPEPASGTYNSTHQNSPEPSGTCKLPRNLHQHTPELSGTYTSTRRNSPEPSGTCFRNLHQHTPELSGTTSTHRNFPHQHAPELSGTFRNLPPEPAPATRTGTHRSLSGLKTPLAYAAGEKGKTTRNYATSLNLQLRPQVAQREERTFGRPEGQASVNRQGQKWEVAGWPNTGKNWNTVIIYNYFVLFIIIPYNYSR